MKERKPLRLPSFDYRQQAVYFLTVCTEKKQTILCTITPGKTPADDPIVQMSPAGIATEQAIRVMPGIDKYVIMPNHIHLIVINEDGKDVSQKIRIMKSIVTAKIHRSIWQRSFYDHVIRDEQDYLTKWKYIDENPAKWATDDYYPSKSP